MGKRTVGKGRGSVFAGGRVFVEGATIPDDVEVGKHVFTDVDDESVELTSAVPAETEAEAEDTSGGKSKGASKSE